MIEFGPNGIIDHSFGSGTGHDQEERFASVRWAQMLGVKRGSCRSCGGMYVSNTSDIAGLCNQCLGRGWQAVEEIKPEAVASTPRTTFGATEHLPMGFDGLEDWRGEER